MIIKNTNKKIIRRKGRERRVGEQEAENDESRTEEKNRRIREAEDERGKSFITKEGRRRRRGRESA